MSEDKKTGPVPSTQGRECWGLWDSRSEEFRGWYQGEKDPRPSSVFGTEWVRMVEPPAAGPEGVDEKAITYLQACLGQKDDDDPIVIEFMEDPNPKEINFTPWAIKRAIDSLRSRLAPRGEAPNG